MRRWSRDVFSDPGSWLSMSAMFLLLSLPLVTWGLAWTLLALYAKDHEEGRKFKCFPGFKAFLGTRAALYGFLFGLADLVFALAFALSLTALIAPGAGLLSRLVSCVFLWLDALYLLSGIYRYPLLAEDGGLSFPAALSKGLLLTLGNLPNVVLVFMVGLCVAALSLCSGIFIFLFFPGALALLHRHNYQVKLGQGADRGTDEGKGPR